MKKDISKEEIRKFIEKHGTKMRNADIARALGTAESLVRYHRQLVGVQYMATKYVPEQTPLSEQVYALMKKKRNAHTIASLSDSLDVGVTKVKTAIETLRAQGKNIRFIQGGIELSSEIPKTEDTRIDVKKLQGKTIRFGLTSDNHLASKYARMDVLNALYDIWSAQGIDTVYQCGNMIDGEARFNKFELLAVGVEGQADFFAKHWPARKGITTKFITGDDHEGWYIQREGINIGKYLEDTAIAHGRKDLVYLGHMEHDIIFTGTKQKSVLRLIHAGGGSSYATSYAPQKIVESYQGGEKPNILLVGHYHKAEYGYPREVHVVQAGCTSDQSSFMRKNKLQAHVGGWTIEFTLTPEGFITRFKCEWIPFYDKGFYDKAWKQQFLK